MGEPGTAPQVVRLCGFKIARNPGPAEAGRANRCPLCNWSGPNFFWCKRALVIV